MWRAVPTDPSGTRYGGYSVVHIAHNAVGQPVTDEVFAKNLHWTDALSVVRLLSAHDRLRKPAQEGDGIAASLRRLLHAGARHVVDAGIRRVPALSHVRTATRLLAALSPRHAAVADDDRVYAHAARDVYAAPEARSGRGYRRDLSTAETAVYERAGARPLVAFRGSANLDDAKTDAALALGQLKSTARWKRSREELARVRAALGDDFEAVGHSLGGTLAAAHADEHNMHATVFNPGATAFGTVHGAKSARVYRTEQDVVSALSGLTHDDVRVVPTKNTSAVGELAAHGVDNFE